MSTTVNLSPQPKSVVIHNQPYTLVAFYYPGYDTPWDKVYCAQFLTNFYLCSIDLSIDGITGHFHCAEAAFQATKWWHNPADRQAFENAQTGKDAFITKKGLPDPDPTYAGLGQLGAMKAVLEQKFSDPDLQKGLLQTGDAYLLEHREYQHGPHSGDTFWSDASDGSGGNHLGRTLMELRAALGGSPAPAGQYSVADFSRQV